MQVLKHWNESLQKRGIRLLMACPSQQAMEMCCRAGLFTQTGEGSTFWLCFRTSGQIWHSLVVGECSLVY